ncbi:MAG TPA: hypothetical protein VEV84_01825 [Pyrinomonadaceae bacterium]|nr:hypothetical protein [Pyrinomonadaceae bacterium]
MFQYLSFPIYVVYSMHWQEETGKMAQQFFAAGDRHMYDWFSDYSQAKTEDIGVGSALMEIVEDSAPAYFQEAKDYENAIKQSLDKIFSTTIGKWLFTMLNPDVKVFILPNPYLKGQTAMTSRVLTAKQGGGIRISFNPKPWGNMADDALIHELTHALRRGTNRYTLVAGLPIGDFPSSEEFFAVQISNIYRSSLRKTGLYEEYYSGTASSDMGSIYSDFADTPASIVVLKYFLDFEPLARHLALLPIGKPSYNPFRDFPILERKALGKGQSPGQRAQPFMYLKAG